MSLRILIADKGLTNEGSLPFNTEMKELCSIFIMLIKILRIRLEFDSAFACLY